MNYIKKKPQNPSFFQDGMNGYSFDIDNQNISIDIEEVYKGHEKYCKNKESSHIFYVISGEGKFKINNEIYSVQEGDIVEIPSNTEFVYAGIMKLLLIMNPAFDLNNTIEGKDNDLYEN